MIKTYRVVRLCCSATNFTKEIQEMIDDNWQPYGDMIFVSGREDTYIQVMVKDYKASKASTE